MKGVVKTMYDIIIIGAGPAGLTAAIYAKRYGMNVVVFEKLVYGGQVSTTPEVENYPGIKSISGFELSTNLYNQALDLDIPIKMESVISVSLVGDIKNIKTSNDEYSAKTIIIANGAKRRLLDCEGEQEFSGKGVSYCATCDGAFFKNQDVAIVGGGNTALEDALFLANNCSKVYLIHRRDEFRGMKVLIDSVISKSNIEILYDTKVQQITGDKKVSNIVTIDKNGDKKNILVNAVFIAVGTIPDNEIFGQDILCDESGYIKAGEDCKTNIDGIYVAGDIRTKELRQIVTATSDGAVAAFGATNYINTSH